jgi:hypothetical protein
MILVDSLVSWDSSLVLVLILLLTVDCDEPMDNIRIFMLCDVLFFSFSLLKELGGQHVLTRYERNVISRSLTS